RLAQNIRKSANLFRSDTARVLRLAHRQTAEPDAREQRQQYRWQPLQRQGIERETEPDHRTDKADRTPHADAAVVLVMPAQMRERDNLELRMHGIPEKAVTGNDKSQPVKILTPENAGKQQCRYTGADADDTQARLCFIG